ncbi:hypothetical protein [Clostridium magnum]|uniref:Uncharacterized protein n=1 Tax=Clostridium magnum DSM 2767 TaxID=1121326 RepID=A0A162UJ81_9CLOT|nr:hypothetical protein [Clostridium magnum]KZL93981.1 hypothetical protein CLMAG_10340 [Clostridium magnum DSM 2767]SHH99778.1 hypothetical protein SAMN02745944_02058 [Clostridium magnum DSM 2767]
MDIYEGRRFIKQLLNKHQISISGIEETNCDEFDAYYDQNKNKIFFNFENIKKSATYFQINLDDYFEIITCHEIGHIMDLKDNGGYYKSIYDECKQEMKDINFGKDSNDDKYEKMDKLTMKLNKVENMREELAWEKGVDLVRDDLIEKYNNFAHEVISQLKQKNHIRKSK